MKNHWKNGRVESNKIHPFNKAPLINQIINIGLIFFLAFITITYYSSPNLVILLYKYTHNITYLVHYFIPFFNNMVAISKFPQLTISIVTSIYFINFLLFLNIYIVTLKSFNGKPDAIFNKSFQGLYEFLEMYIYGRFSVSISLLRFSEMLWGKQKISEGTLSSDTYAGLVFGYRNFLFIYFIFLSSISIAVAWLAIGDVNDHKFNLFCFTVSIALAAYFQFRAIFEIIILSSLFVKK